MLILLFLWNCENLWRLAVSHAISAGSREVTVASKFMSESTIRNEQQDKCHDAWKTEAGISRKAARQALERLISNIKSIAVNRIVKMLTGWKPVMLD
jgi:hypothetical protein